MMAALTIVLLIPSAKAYAEPRSAAPTGIIGAFDEEVRLIEQAMDTQKTERLMGVPFIVGRLRGQPVVVAETGVGKVNAAMTTTLLIDHYHPAEIVFTGIAGGLNPKLAPGDIVIGAKLIQHDLGEYATNGFKADGVNSPVDGKKNPVAFPADPGLVQVVEQASRVTPFASPDGDKATRKPSVLTGTIVTGDSFIASPAKSRELHQQFNADVVEMEGAAVAQICYQAKVPFVVIRSVSDNADEHANRDLARFYKTAAENSANLVLKVMESLAARENQHAAPVEHR